ncbi:hypothetical protein SAMN02910358_02404 [Lachnospiraceae bacterium XBB1006]|nr:hypothetical protein SAMN02910358_02404 [Lachnospiraceae bacterium XBB1006]
MNEMKKRKFQILENSDEEIQEEKRKHRKRILRIGMAVVTFAVVLATGLHFYHKYKTYNRYEVKQEQKTEYVSEADFYDYSGNLLKVSKNGAIYTKMDGSLLWNQSYEMNAPLVDICKDYVVIAAKKGREAYIFNTKGLEGKVETSGEIRAVEVAKQGTIAVMTERNDSYYVNMYDPKGTKLVQGEMHIENSGYPLAMSLSADGIKLAISMVTVKGGQVDTTLNFYNFGAVGQNEIDNLVKSDTYENQLIPRIVYFDEDHVVAISGQKLYFYKGAQKPTKEKVVSIKGDIRSLVIGQRYLGLTFYSKNGSQHELKVYDYKGKAVMSSQYRADYNHVAFLGESEIVLTKGALCRIYTMDGTVKYSGELEEPIVKVSQGEQGNEYYIIYERKMQQIRLK